MIFTKNTNERYGKVAMFLHWAIFILFAISVTLGLTMTNMEDGDTKWFLYSLHKSFGLTIALLVVIRIVWRLTNLTPAMPNTLKNYEKLLAQLTHYGFYAVMILMPISGYVDSLAGSYKLDFFGLFNYLWGPPIESKSHLFPSCFVKNEMLEQLALNIHVYTSYAFYILFGLHIGGVLKHHFVLKDNTLRRMLPVNLKSEQ